MAVFVVEFPGVLVPMVAWGIKIVCKKFEEFLTKIDIFLRKMVKIIFFHIFAQLHALFQFIFVCEMDEHCM